MTSTYHEDAANTLLSQEIGQITLSDDAPEVDLQLLVIENKGLRIARHPIMGRVTVATQSFDELGVPILREYPALVCKSDDYMDFMEQFLDCTEEVQVGILNMFYQPLSSPMGKSLVEPAKILFFLGVLEDFTVIHQLLSIYTTNGHQYQGTKSALPIFGSKIPHSCLPNVGYSSQTNDDGCVEYKLIRPIQDGDVVTFSYLSDLFETPTSERREILLQTKSFVCMCERCTGPDYCRYLKCQTCQIMVPCQYQTLNLEPFWECPSCGHLDQDQMISMECKMETILETIEQAIERNIHKKMSFNRKSEYSPALLQELVQECSSRMSPTHYLTVKALRILLQICASSAYVQIKRLVVRGQPWSNSTLVHSQFRKSVDAGFQLVAACECVAAGCPGCGPLFVMVGGDDNKSSNTTTSGMCLAHEPLYDRATPMRHICDNLLQIPAYSWPSHAVTMTKRYLPFLKAKFGQVDEIETKIVKAWEDTACLECGTVVWNGGSPT